MLLVDPNVVGPLLGISCGIGREAQQGGTTASDLAAILNMVLPRVEAACDTKSLALQQRADTFSLAGRGIGGRYQLRLTNGFIAPSSLAIANRKTGVIFAADDPTVDVDYERGLVYLPVYGNNGSSLQVQYGSGFPAIATELDDGTPIPESQQIFDVPQWLQTIAIAAVSEWLRSIPVTVKVSEGMSFRDVASQANRYIQTQIWQTYMRPRADVIYPDFSSIIVPVQPL
jgi:hypothetical protein